jgi:hypothetical protein
VDRLIEDIRGLTARMDDVATTFGLCRGAKRVLGVLMATLVVFLGWYATGRLPISFKTLA